MTKVKKHVVKVASGIMAGMMAVGGVFTGLPMFASADSGSYYEKVEFETANRFSSDSGNRVENSQFSGYSGDGYVYLVSGWGEVGFSVPKSGNYRITLVTNSDQYKENWVYLDDNSAGVAYTQGNTWNETVVEAYLSEGTHKVGVSSNWGYVALDYAIIESLDSETESETTTPEETTKPEDTTNPDETQTSATYEFEDANHMSDDYGNRVENNQFSGYSGSGYVYLASGWADVTFPITEAGKYNITITSTSDQYKENWLYLDDSSAGTLKTEAGSWNSYTYTCDLTEGTHKFGVSTSWGYVALDNVKVEKVGSSVDVEEETTTTTPDIPVDVVISEDNMYVQGTKLYDANGNEFIMRGVNIPHAWYTDKTETSINAVADLGANCVRVVLADGYQWDKTSREEVENIINICKQNKLICILEVHDYTGKNDPALLQQAVNYWLDLKDLLNANKNYVIVNIANEWLGTWDLGSTWADTYCEAIKRMRNAGIENVIMVDASGYGQETKYLISDCKKVLAADTTGNTMFSIHMYSVAGADASTVKSNIDNTLANNVCLCIGEFGDFQNGGDVDERTIIDYSQEKGVGTIAWSWKGNGGTDVTLDLSSDWAGKNLTDWGKVAFGSDNAIQATSRLAYYLTGFGGDVIEDAPDNVDTPDNDVVIIPPSLDGEIGIDADKLSAYDTEWYVSAEGDDVVSTVSKLEELSNGGYRVTYDMGEEKYAYFSNMVNGVDLSSNDTLSIVVRNNNTYAVQIQPIFKNGDLWKWTEYDNYQTVPASTTVMLTFDMSGCTTRDEVNAMIFRIQGGGSTAAGSVDFISMGYDLDEDVYFAEIAELNRPKSADAFTWSYPETSWEQTVNAELKDGGVLSVDFANITDEAAAGIQTETRPSLGVGLDFSLYKTITATITNNSDSDIHITLLLRTSSNWTWQESAGVAEGVEDGEMIIPAGESVDVTYYLKEATWKSKLSNWQYTGQLQDIDDVRAIGFKIYTGGESASGNVEISNFQCNFQ